MCGKAAIKSRGLCETHYRRFKAKLDEFTDPAAAEAFEAKCLEDGWVLPRQKGGRPKEKDPFDEIADEIADLINQGVLKPATDMPTAEPIGEGSTPVGRHRKKAKKIPSPEEVKETLKPKKSGKKQGGAG